MKPVIPGGDYDVQLTLELARVAREPTLEDKQRVLEALQVRLGDMPSLSSVGESTTGVRLVVPKVTRATLGAHAAHLARSLASSKAAMHLIWVGAATGALGFWAGVQLTEPEPVAAPRPVASVVRGPSAPPAAPEPPAVVTVPRNEPESSPPGRTVPGPMVVAPLTPETPRVEPLQPADVRPRALVPAPLAPVKPPPPGPAPVARRAHDAARGSELPARLDDNGRFFEAVRLLQRAQRALDGGELALALVLLEELDARFPRELLGEEREAALVIALCKGGDVERASRLARELATRSPSSIYAARIARSCGSFDTTSGSRH